MVNATGENFEIFSSFPIKFHIYYGFAMHISNSKRLYGHLVSVKNVTKFRTNAVEYMSYSSTNNDIASKEASRCVVLYSAIIIP